MAKAQEPAGLRLVKGRADGRDSGGRVVKPPPSFVRAAPEPPEWLPDDARALWARVVPELLRLSLTKPLDAESLTAYCLAWQRICDARRLARDHSVYRVEEIRNSDGEVTDVITHEGYGLLATNSQGIVRAPWTAIEEAASADLRKWAAEFGLTPSAEGKVSAVTDNGEESNPFGG